MTIRFVGIILAHFTLSLIHTKTKRGKGNARGSLVAFPVSNTCNGEISYLPSSGGRIVKCMGVHSAKMCAREPC